MTGYTTRSYGRMIGDGSRTAAYVEALRRAVTPGSVVLDVGTGTGFFALLACRLGAARVYAIEPADAIHVARQCAGSETEPERIVWLQARSTEVDLPERVDVIVADLRGVLPFLAGSVSGLIDARRRHLKQGGHVIPSRDVLRAVPAEAPAEYQDLVTPWERNDYGVDLSAGRPFVANSWWRAGTEPVEPGSLLAPAACWGEIDYARVDSPHVKGTCEWVIERAGIMHGLYVWFDCEAAHGLGYSNAPWLPELVYGRAFFPFLQPLDVAPGYRVRTTISATQLADEYVYSWKSTVADGEGRITARFDQSTFAGTPLTRSVIRRRAADFVPRLNAAGEVDRLALECMADGVSLGQIAERLTQRFPRQFPQLALALQHVARLSEKYSVAEEPAAPQDELSVPR